VKNLLNFRWVRLKKQSFCSAFCELFIIFALNHSNYRSMWWLIVSGSDCLITLLTRFSSHNCFELSNLGMSVGSIWKVNMLVS
jgi:apolipoprotein N-acyltransferase